MDTAGALGGALTTVTWVGTEAAPSSVPSLGVMITETTSPRTKWSAVSVASGPVRTGVPSTDHA